MSSDGSLLPVCGRWVHGMYWYPLFPSSAEWASLSLASAAFVFVVILCSRLLRSGHHCLWHLLHSFLLFGVNLTVSVSFAIPFRNFSNSCFMISTNELVLASSISSLISLMVSYLCFLKAASAWTSSSVHQLHLLTASEAWNTTLDIAPQMFHILHLKTRVIRIDEIDESDWFAGEEAVMQHWERLSIA